MLSRENLQEKESLLTFVSKAVFNAAVDQALQTVKLLIIDEVHLLNEERGAVIETIVARTLRQV